MKVGIIGTGNIGQAVGALLVKAGHEVLFASRNPQELAGFVASLGKAARAGTAMEAAQHGDAVIVAVPLGAIPKLGAEVRSALSGKVVIDTTNPYPQRDGELASDAVAAGKGTGTWFAGQFSSARVVKGFNTVYSETLKSEAHRAGVKIAIPLAGDDRPALETAARLVTDAGFDAVIVGPLARSAEFDVGTAPYGKPHTTQELRSFFG